MLTIMLENSALHSRLLFFIALVCAAVMSFIMCSDAARVSPITTQVHNGVKRNVLRRLYTPYSQHHPLSTVLSSTETELQTRANSETKTSGNYREALSIIDHQSIPPRFTEGAFSYNQNIPDNRHPQGGVTGVQSEVRSASSIFTSHSQHGGQSFERRQSGVNYHPLTQKVSQSRNSYYSYPVIIRKSSHKETASPFHQSSRPSQVWDPKDAQKSHSNEKVPRNDSPKVTEDETVWPPYDSSLFSSQTGRYWNTLLPTSRGYYSGYKEMNKLAVVRPKSTSSGIQTRKFLSFASQNSPHAPSISNVLGASVIKSNPSLENLTTSITDFSQGLHSVSSSETPRHKKVQSYLFKDSQTSFGGHDTVSTVTGDSHVAFSTTPHKQRTSDAQVYGWFSSNFKHSQQSQREEPTKEVQHLSDNANSLYHNANIAQYTAQTDSLTKYQGTTAETLAQMSVHPAPGRDNTMESVVPIPNVDFQGNYDTGSEKSVVGSLVNTTPRGSIHAYKPGRTIKSIYGFNGFKNPLWRAVKESSILSSNSSNERTTSRQYSFDKGKFKIANVYPSLSSKYSFSQREASTTPAKLERTPTDYSSASPGTLDVVKTTTTPRPSTLGFKETRPLLPGSDAGMDGNPDRRQFRIYRKIYGLKGLGPRPLEGDKPLVSEPDKSAKVHQSFEGFALRNSQMWQLKTSRIHRWYNKTEPGNSHVSTMSQNEQNSEDLKPLLMTAGSTEAFTRFTPDKYKKNRKIYTHLGFHPVQRRIGNANKTHWEYKEQNPTTASASHRISSAYLRSAGDLKVESSPKPKPRTPNKMKPVAMKASLFNSSTRSTVRGKRVKGKHLHGKKLNESTSLTNDAGYVAIVRLPKQPARVKAVTYADILGSASFSGVRATTQTPITPADMDYFPNTIATKQKAGAGHWTLNSEDVAHSRDNTSKGPEAHTEDEGEDFSSVEENALGVGSEDVDSDMKTSDLFLDNEGSGSGGFNMSDVFSTDTTKNQGLGEDLLELDYLRISTGNISFKSMKLSHSEK